MKGLKADMGMHVQYHGRRGKRAKQPMAEYYRLTDAAHKPLLTDDLVGRMYRHLEKARGMTKDPTILARIDDLVLYTRYVDQWLDYSLAAFTLGD